MLHKRKIGSIGEDIAIRYFQKHGYTLLCRNIHWRDGEIDLAFTKADVLVCVEVKLRRNNRHGYPQEAITQRKRQKLYQLAFRMREQYPQYQQVQVDFLGLTIDQNRKRIFLQHWPNIHI